MEVEGKSVFERQIDDLINKQKIARQNSDTAEILKITEQILKLAFDLNEHDKLFELLKVLSNKRGQPKKAQNAMVTQCMGYLNTIQQEEKRIKYITIVKEVCDKKIHLEVEYARCCLMLVKNKQDEKELDQAAQILQDVQVETYGTMDMREKVEFILYQMKIQLKKRDFIRLAIVSRKINPKNLNLQNILDLKVLFYSYMIALHINDQNFLEIAKAYKQIYDTLSQNEELREKIPKKIDFEFETDYAQCLESFVLFLVMANHSTEQQTLLNELQQKYVVALEALPNIRHLVESWFLEELISTQMEKYNISNLFPFRLTTQKADEHITAFQKQLIHHNLRVIHQYYQRIRINRLVQLLEVPVESIEVEICEMIENNLIYCKIDRVNGILQFRPRRNQNEVFEDWTQSLGKVLDLIEETSNLIKREEEIKFRL